AGTEVLDEISRPTDIDAAETGGGRARQFLLAAHPLQTGQSGGRADVLQAFPGPAERSGEIPLPDAREQDVVTLHPCFVLGLLHLGLVEAVAQVGPRSGRLLRLPLPEQPEGTRAPQ